MMNEMANEVDAANATVHSAEKKLSHMKATSDKSLMFERIAKIKVTEHLGERDLHIQNTRNSTTRWQIGTLHTTFFTLEDIILENQSKIIA